MDFRPSSSSNLYKYKFRPRRLSIRVRLSEKEDAPEQVQEPQVVTAIWDTGAGKTVISNRIAKILRLQPDSLGYIHTASHTVISAQYSVFLEIEGYLALETAVLSSNLPSHFDAVIGMDVINLGDFAISNDGVNTFLSVRTPSMGKIA